jgi:uncharacterized protein (DUF1778 family)
MRKTSAKSERLEARITREQKELLLRAAELRGLSLTDFLIDSAHRAAEATIREHTIMTLTGRDSSLFVEALLHPSTPNPTLRAAFAHYATDDTPPEPAE